MESDPGLGKSLLATVFIKESGRRSYVFRKTSQENSFLDELRAAFSAAKEAAGPTPLFVPILPLKFIGRSIFKGSVMGCHFPLRSTKAWLDGRGSTSLRSPLPAMLD